MRIKLTKKSRKQLFKKLLKEKRCKTYTELAKKLKLPHKTLQKWLYGQNYIPSTIIPNYLINKLKILDKQEDNWGTKKGGKKGIKILNKKYKGNLKEWRSLGGKLAVKKLRKWINKNPKEFKKRLIKGKYKRTKILIEQNAKMYDNYFTNNEFIFNHQEIKYSKNDIKKRVHIPKILTPDLAEEIGIHCGDGTLPDKKYYFSVRGHANEKEYYSKFILDLYKRLFNLNLKLLDRNKIYGIEFSSKAIYLFKNKVLGLPTGKKVNQINIPNCIIESHNKEIIRSFIRGVFDTDGCISFKKGRDYPSISILIKSKKFMSNLKMLLERLGFIPRLYNDYTININGPVQLKKWYKDIGSSNPKHLNKIEDYLDRAPVV